MTIVTYSAVRRRRLRKGIAIIAVIIFWFHFFSQWEADVHDYSEFSSCVQQANYALLGQFFILGTSGLYFFILIIVYLLRIPVYLRSIVQMIHAIWKRGIVEGTSRTERSSQSSAMSPQRRAALSLLCIAWGHVLLWMNFHGIIQLRRGSSKHRSEDNLENRMGYGQIISLFIWLPLDGPRRGAEGKIPTPFVVQEPGDEEFSRGTAATI
ncbi:hypothetical protein FRC17_007779 [Serendipita sp. 399]|nr:hypothetical protein FRC17_007779 [Serendipita sp. 399]